MMNFIAILVPKISNSNFLEVYGWLHIFKFPCMDSKLLDRLRNYFQSQPVERVWLFGSFSRGEEKEGSDLDFLVEFSKGIKIGLQYFRIISDLELLSDRQVDLAEPHMIDPRVSANINNEKILIYERTN